jgi:N-hydroxyarylamine O-acetyltransferase
VATPELDVDRYLRRIGMAGHPALRTPSLASLTALHEAHVASIPFENLDVLLGRPVRLDLASVEAKLVAARRGGYCFEHNTLFMAVLENLGFEVTSLAARVRMGAAGLRPRTHMLLRVDLPDRQFLADVGFGGDGPLRPIPLDAAGEVQVGATSCRLRREGDLWVLQGNMGGDWTDLYAFNLERHFPADYEMANHYTSTHPQSRFVRNLIVQRSQRDRRIVLLNRDLMVRAPGSATTASTLKDPEELLQALETHFGLSFPPGTRFARPEF